MSHIKQIHQIFQTKFDSNISFRLFRAPGRVNLIGEHTDYNDGFVLPAAIDRQIVIAAAPRDDDKINVYAHKFDQWDHFAIEKKMFRLSDDHWGNYLRAMAWVLNSNGYKFKGMDAVISGDIPMGAGLSSSAAIEVAMGYALLTLSNAKVSLPQLARMAQQAENDFVGMRCGIMDQFISCLGKLNHALLIDCRDLSYRAVPLPPDAPIVIVDSGVHRGLVEGKYNARRKECESAAAFFKVKKLRDVTLENFNAHAHQLSGKVKRRARHVISENQRTIEASKALEDGDLEEVGNLMKASHDSMRDDFQISCPELDYLVDIAMETQGVFGARMTGGGFGGCMVALVKRKKVDDLLENIKKQYPTFTNRQAAAYICQPSAGVSEINDNSL